MKVLPIHARTPRNETKLSDLACTIDNSRGRQIKERPPSHRSEFQRDRDRVIHCSAFRRLEYKTQVFSNYAGDMFRTRLTHSLEVAQVARTIARALQVNEDLTEAISLAHDLGHTPFGHAGQDALNKCMASYGGFEHNYQSLRVVDKLEQRYFSFDGLNLLFETREGILKHCSNARAAQLGAVGKRILEKRAPSIEAQIANLADEIAYNHHDIDDGLRAQILTPELLSESSLFNDVYSNLSRQNPHASAKQIKHAVLREMLSIFVNDLIDASLARYSTLDENDSPVRPAIIGFSEPIKQEHIALKRLLFKYLYRHPKIEQNNNLAKDIIKQLFEYFIANPSQMNADPSVLTPQDHSEIVIHVADYIAGMTDRFAVTTFTDLLKSHLEQVTFTEQLAILRSMTTLTKEKNQQRCQRR